MNIYPSPTKLECSVIKGEGLIALQYSALIEDSDTQIPSVRPE